MTGEKETEIESYSELETAYDLGVMIQYLKQEKDYGYNVQRLSSAFDNVNKLLDRLEWTDRYVENLENIRDQLEQKYDGDEVLDENDSERLLQHLGVLERDLRAILSNHTMIRVQNPGLFDVRTAMESPEKLFEPEVWAWMPENSKGDVEEACRSLAASCHTASTFLALRSVEDRLRFWYKNRTGEEIEQTWGRVISKLEDEYEPGERPPVLSNLDYLREKRNEVSHPEKSPNESEAITTLYMVRGTIKEIYEELD